MKLNKNGRIEVLVVQDEIDGLFDEWIPLEQFADFATNIQNNWEIGPDHKRQVWVKEVTFEEWLECIRNGMEHGGHQADEIRDVINSVRKKHEAEMKTLTQ